ncbi:MAG: o-succinylbenzoate synthase [Candidatus Aminicenantes bacterium]|nr:o-succinylbenzoate synthase [Candidatus Aminicenantes bacterium]
MDNIGQIDKAELYIVKLPLVTPFMTSYGVIKSRESLLLKLTSNGHSGWSECASFRDPWYHYETIDTSLHIAVKYLIPLLLKAIDIKADMITDLFAGIKGHNMSKAMIENAVLDLYARKIGKPLYEILGGKKKRIRSGISLGISEDVNNLIDQINNAVRKKYHRIKVKIKKGYDVNVISAIRSDFPYINLVVDANGSYNKSDTGTLRMLDNFDLKMIEQPFGTDDFLMHSQLQEQINTPICLDESISGLHSVVSAVNFKSCKVICVKQGRLGGLIRSIELKDLCAENGLKVWCGGMLETGIGRAFNLHLQTIDGFEFPGDTSETSRYFMEDIVTEPVVLDNDGYINIPDNDGFGFEVDQEKIDKFMVFRKIMMR